jgi:hypothetical protein
MPTASDISLDRMVRAVEKVRERLLRAVAALESANVAYAVVGGHAVAAWVSTLDEAAVRTTRDVDILIRREDLDRARAAMEGAGFVYRHVAAIDVFLDGPDASPRDGVHLVFSGEKVRSHEPEPNPTVDEAQQAEHFRVISLEALVRIKLTAFRDKDRTHLRDMIEVGLLDSSWSARLGPELGSRLDSLLNDPFG